MSALGYTIFAMIAAAVVLSIWLLIDARRYKLVSEPEPSINSAGASAEKVVQPAVHGSARQSPLMESRQEATPDLQVEIARLSVDPADLLETLKQETLRATGVLGAVTVVIDTESLVETSFVGITGLESENSVLVLRQVKGILRDTKAVKAQKIEHWASEELAA